jgi:hypothetical protein
MLRHLYRALLAQSEAVCGTVPSQPLKACPEAALRGVTRTADTHPILSPSAVSASRPYLVPIAEQTFLSTARNLGTYIRQNDGIIYLTPFQQTMLYQ